LASHAGRPKPNEYDEANSLRVVKTRLKTLLKMADRISLAKDVVGDDAKAKVEALKAGEVLLLENLRFEEGETKNDIEFAKRLASFADVYINDAFGVCHRAHASVEAMPKIFPKERRGAGFLLSKEINFFKKKLDRPIRPFVAVVGGSRLVKGLRLLEV